MKIAYLTKDDPQNVTHWSGIHYFMQRHLMKKGVEIYNLGPVNLWRSICFKMANRISILVSNKALKPHHTISSSKAYSKIFKKKIDKLPKEIELIFAVNASSEVAHLNVDLPIVYLSGTTFELIHDYYSSFSNLFNFNIKANQLIEQSAIQKSTKLIYPSNWAAQSAIQDYGANPNDVHVIPYGANIENTPDREEILPPAPEKIGNNEIKLLFVGKDWQRKGGPIALKTAKILDQYGLNIKLAVCGCNPEIKEEMQDIVDIYPFLDKNNPKDRETLDQLYKSAHFFILPTQKENFGVVFSEASAYGLPIATTYTGGIPTIIEDDKQGLLFSATADGNRYAERIYKLLNDEDKYFKMCRNARENYEQRLNWNIWSQNVVNVFKQILPDRE